MDLAQYFSQQDGTVSFTENQGSAFAKGIAQDFNPIHDPGSKRFCVPGDLLFCVLLRQYGVAHTTAVQFSGMLGGETRIRLQETITEQAHIVDDRDRALLSLYLKGERLTHAGFVSALSEAYVRFSGQTFPDILVPLMRSANVMINPDRPLVIYKDMAIDLNADWCLPAQFDEKSTDVTLQLSDTDISVNGRKGAVRLQFDIQLADDVIGSGEKNMVLSGLRDFEASSMQSIVDQYTQWRDAYAARIHSV
ncbi:MAG: DUF3581 family protein [Granulosicoccus sp.]